jgi:hypothetical protein
MNRELFLNHYINNSVKGNFTENESINMDKAEFIGNGFVISETKSVPLYLDAKIDDLRLFYL